MRGPASQRVVSYSGGDSPQSAARRLVVKPLIPSVRSSAKHAWHYLGMGGHSLYEVNYSRVDIPWYKTGTNHQFTCYLDAEKTALTLDSRRGAVLSTVCHVAPPQYVHEAR